MPSTTLSRTRSAIRSISFALFTWYGISETMMAIFSPFRLVSTAVRARMTIDPRPVVYACRMPSRPTMEPAVGKSGPGISRTSCFSFSPREIGASPSALRCVCAISQMQPSITSRRLCGGTFVAMPTAMPADPFTRRFGNGAGRTIGSSVVSS